MVDPRRAAIVAAAAAVIAIAAVRSPRALAGQNAARGGRWYKGVMGWRGT